MLLAMDCLPPSTRTPQVVDTSEDGQSGRWTFVTRRCGRDFIQVISTGAVQAVAIGVFSFWVLSHEVTLRWGRECPGEVLSSDGDDRLKRVAEVTLLRPQRS